MRYWSGWERTGSVTKGRRRRWRRGSKSKTARTGRRRYKDLGPFVSWRMGRFCFLVEDQDSGRNHRGPKAALVAYRGLGDIGGADDLVRDTIDLFLLVPGTVGVEFDVESGGQHLGSEFFGIVTGRGLGLSERVVLAEVAVCITIGGDSHTNAGRQQAVRFVGRVFGHDGKNHFARA